MHFFSFSKLQNAALSYFFKTNVMTFIDIDYKCIWLVGKEMK